MRNNEILSKITQIQEDIQQFSMKYEIINNINSLKSEVNCLKGNKMKNKRKNKKFLLFILETIIYFRDYQQSKQSCR